MRSRSAVLICICIAVILSFAASPAVAQGRFHRGPPVSDGGAAEGESAAAGVKCKPVVGFLGELVSFESCVYQGHYYEWCAGFPVWGTLTGTLYYYTQPELNLELQVPEGMLAESWSFIVASAVVEIDTDKGKVFAQDNAVWHSEMVGPEFVEIDLITGGTDRYAGATGWFGMAGPNQAGVAVMTGEICTPIDE